MSKLSSEEREILEAFEKGKLKQSNKAANTQKRALAEGIPYQTLIASMLHKYVEGRLNESNG